MEFFRVEEPGTGQTVPLTWLKLFWVRKHSDAMSFRSAYLRRTSDEEQDPGVIPDAGGMFGGHAVFTEALTKDIQPELARTLASCPLATYGGRQHGPGPHPRVPYGNVWIFVNGETSQGWEFWAMMEEFLDPGDKGVILGNWWNDTHESYHGERVTSIWVPFASTSFAERRLRTPMDLVQRSRRTQFEHSRQHLVAYQQHGCNDWREHFWDVLNTELYLRNMEPGSALSMCNGHRESGRRVSLRESPGLGHMDASVERYENFEFVWSAEHGQNRHGYITEKIVNALLAGAVPVYAGSSQVGQVFNTDSFIQVDMSYDAARHEAAKRVIAASHDKERYSKLQHRDKPVVSDAAMKRFFTWHPDVWATYGDGLRQEVLHEALRFCKGGH